LDREKVLGYTERDAVAIDKYCLFNARVRQDFFDSKSISVSELKKAFAEADFELGKESGGETIPFDIYRDRVLSKFGWLHENKR